MVLPVKPYVVAKTMKMVVRPSCAKRMNPSQCL